MSNNSSRGRPQSYFASPDPYPNPISQSHPFSSHQLPFPDTPPSTPPLEKSEMLLTSTSSQLSLNLASLANVHRHTFDSATPDSPNMSEPLPSLAENDEIGSPRTNYEVATPDMSPLIVPNLQLEGSLMTPYRFEAANLGFPTLPSHHHLRKQLHGERKSSVPTAPKGHPLTRPLASSFSMDQNSVFHKAKTLLGFYIRIPRPARVLLLACCTMMFFGSLLFSLSSTSSSLAPPRFVSTSDHFDKRAQLRLMESLVPVQPTKYAAPTISFQSKEDELLALLSFITSSTSHTLPALDPAQPLSPEVILGFEPSSQEDLASVNEEVNALYPIVLLGRMRDPWHREIQKMLAQYKITPSPVIIDVDQRPDHLLLVPLLERLLGASSLPQLLLLGKSMGSYHDVLALRDSGLLQNVLESSRAVTVRTAKPKKNKGRREEERNEMERILGPKPIDAQPR